MLNYKGRRKEGRNEIILIVNSVTCVRRRIFTSALISFFFSCLFIFTTLPLSTLATEAVTQSTESLEQPTEQVWNEGLKNTSTSIITMSTTAAYNNVEDESDVILPNKGVFQESTSQMEEDSINQMEKEGTAESCHKDIIIKEIPKYIKVRANIAKYAIFFYPNIDLH